MSDIEGAPGISITTDSSVARKRAISNEPFSDLNLSSHNALRAAVRTECPNCNKKRRYFCAECIVPLVTPPEAIPTVSLPLHVHILQTGAENPQRSTAQHVPLLAPAHATVWRPFPDCSDKFYDEVLKTALDGSIAVLYPSKDAFTPHQALSTLPNLSQIIVIDSTWTKSVLLASHPHLDALPKLTLPPGYSTRFWRYAPKRGVHSEYFNPDKVGCLMSTVESVHRFCVEYNLVKGETKLPCDDLLWMFSFLHSRVREVYEKAPGKRQRILRKSKGLLHQF